MKRHLYIIIFSCLSCVIFNSCEKGFSELNTNPNASPVVNPEFTFTKAQLDAAANTLMLLQGTMQYTTSFNDVAGFGSKYVLSQRSASYGAFTNAYPKEVNEIVSVINVVKDDPALSNLLAASRIWKVYIFSRLSDLYGDIPYTQAGKGYTDAIYKPFYDTQQNIYADMLKELDESANSFDASKKTFGAADLVYSGNIVQWKKFAYSLMLRLAMRMTKVDVTNSEVWAKKAIAGGVILDNVDIAKVNGYVSAGQDINKNPLALNMLNSDYIKGDGTGNTEGGKFQEVFINSLKLNNDPRLGVLSVVYVNGKADTSAAIQKGMPPTFNSKPVDFVSYSEPNQNTILQLNSPFMLITNAETNFILAEASLRGWYSSSSASVLYEKGIRASMQQWALFGPAGVITDNQIDNYIKYHKLETSAPMAAQMEQIYSEFWIGVYPNFQEVFATYRRTGFPALVPNNYVGNATGGKIFRRMEYPLTERNLNAENYMIAVARQGADDFLTRVWWDK